MTSIFESLVPLSDIEDVLAWVDTFKLTRATKKINRDFSDAVLLAEILMVHYPKLVEMHNYPPRNSHALKLNNWMTLNRKVMKKLRLHLCSNTMEQLANSAPGVIERVLIMVRDKIRRDAEANKEAKESDQNLSSGGEYFEAGGDDDQVLVVPLKMRVNGVLETIQQRVVSHESYLGLKEELRDAKEAADLLKQRVEHLDSLLKLKEERIEELQKQLDRKASRRHEVEAQFYGDTSQPPSIKSSDVMIPLKVPSIRSLDISTKTPLPIPVVEELSNISVPITPDETPEISATKMEHERKPSIAIMDLQARLSTPKIFATKIEHEPKPSIAKMDLQAKLSTPNISATKMEQEPKPSVAKMDLQAKLSTPKIFATKIEHEPKPSIAKMDLQAKLSTPNISATKMEQEPKPSVAKMDLQAKLSTDKMVMSTNVSAIRIEVQPKNIPSNAEVNGDKDSVDLDRVRSDVFQEAEVVQEKHYPTDEEFKDSVQDLTKNGPSVKEVVAISNQYGVSAVNEMDMRHLDSLRRLKEEKTQELKKLLDRKCTLCSVNVERYLPALSDVAVSAVSSTKSNISLKTSNFAENTGRSMHKLEDSSSSKIPVPRKSLTSVIEVQPKLSGNVSASKLQIPTKLSTSRIEIQPKLSADNIVIQKNSATRIDVKPKLSNTSNDAKVNLEDDDVDDLDRVRSDVFKEAAEAVMEYGANAEDDKKNEEYVQMVPSIRGTIQQEIIDITNHLGFKDTSYVN